MKESFDFTEIQKILDRRNAAKKKEEENISQPEPKKIQYELLELRNESKYENMHAQNIVITPYGLEKAKKLRMSIKIGLAITGAVVIGFGFFKLTSRFQSPEDIPVETVSSSHIVENYISPYNALFGKSNVAASKSDKVASNSDAHVINLRDCNISDFTIILRQSTQNVKDVVSVAEQELKELGINHCAINDDEDIIEVVRSLKKENPNRDIIVVNVDGISNKGTIENVIMTNYRNDAISSDALSIAIRNTGEDVYGIASEIRCGKKISDGSRAETSIEKSLREAGETNVACLTVAPNQDCLADEISINNLATTIVDGIIRYASLDNSKRKEDMIRRVEYGDTLSELAESYDVSESYLISTNHKILSEYNGLLKHDTAFSVKDVPINLTSSVEVNNPTVTMDPNDIVGKLAYYEVQNNDIVSKIAEKLDKPIGELIIPSGNPNVIFPGDKIGYEIEEGKILVSKSSYKTSKGN